MSSLQSYTRMTYHSLFNSFKTLNFFYLSRTFSLLLFYRPRVWTNTFTHRQQSFILTIWRKELLLHSIISKSLDSLSFKNLPHFSSYPKEWSRRIQSLFYIEITWKRESQILSNSKVEEWRVGEEHWDWNRKSPALMSGTWDDNQIGTIRQLHKKMGKKKKRSDNLYQYLIICCVHDWCVCSKVELSPT